MKNFVFFWILLGLSFYGYGQEKEDLSVFNYWNYYKDPSNTLRNHIYSEAFGQIDSRLNRINQLTTKDDWLARQSEVREKLNKIVGEFPQKTPLNAVVTGKIKRPVMPPLR